MITKGVHKISILLDDISKYYNKKVLDAVCYTFIEDSTITIQKGKNQFYTELAIVGEDIPVYLQHTRSHKQLLEDSDIIQVKYILTLIQQHLMARGALEVKIDLKSFE